MRGHLTRKEFTEHLRNSMKKAEKFSKLSDWTQNVDKIYYHSLWDVEEYYVVLNSGEHIYCYSDGIRKQFLRCKNSYITSEAKLLSKDYMPAIIAKLKAFEKECN